MRLLLDSHALLWWLQDDKDLARGAWAAIADGKNEVLVSAASIWEIAIKRAQGTLVTPPDIEAAVAEQSFRQLPITFEHGTAAGSLPPHHRDPFDRMLIAQAMLEGLTVVTRDPRFEAYGVRILRA